MENVQLIGVTRGESKPSKVLASLVELNTSNLVLPGAPDRPSVDPNMKFLMICLLPTPNGQIPIAVGGPTQEAAKAAFKQALQRALMELSVISIQQMEVEVPGV
jgi:hypothetical protein